MNLVILIGRLTSDPKLSYTPTTQTAVASFRLAVNRNTKDGGADFIQCKVFGKTAENLDRYKKKGEEIAVKGRLETGSYKNREGITVNTSEVVCDAIEFTHGSKSESSDAPSESLKPSKGFEKPNIDWDAETDSWEQADDDIPF